MMCESRLRIFPVVLVATVLAGCIDDDSVEHRTKYRIDGRYDDDYGACWSKTVWSDWYFEDDEFVDINDLIGSSYLRLDYQYEVWYGPNSEKEGIDDWANAMYVGGSKTDFPVPTGVNQVEQVLMDYPCTDIGNNPRLYWVATERSDTLAGRGKARAHA